MSQAFDANKSPTSLEQDSTSIAGIEMSRAKWLVAAMVQGLDRQPRKVLTRDAPALLRLLHSWLRAREIEA